MPRNTVQQDIIRNTVLNMKTHPTADEVYEKIRLSHPSIGRATVYRVLTRLADSGEISRITLPSGADRFDFRRDEHMHIKCRNCGRVFDAEFPQAGELIDRLRSLSAGDGIAQGTGFKDVRLNISFDGICRDCQKIKQM